jgi:hypothetical protein
MSIVYPVYIKIYTYPAALSLNGSIRGDLCVCRFDSLWEGDRAHAYWRRKSLKRKWRKRQRSNKKKIKRENEVREERDRKDGEKAKEKIEKQQEEHKKRE